MSRENIREVIIRTFHREGVDTLSEVSAFLGGIFFTSLLILIQQREKFDVVQLEINLLEHTIRISQLHLISLPISLTIILFVFSSYFFASACSQPEQSDLDKMADIAAIPFALGVISMFVSLFAVLAIVDIVIGLLGMIVSVGTFTWWVRERKKRE